MNNFIEKTNIFNITFYLFLLLGVFIPVASNLVCFSLQKYYILGFLGILLLYAIRDPDIFFIKRESFLVFTLLILFFSLFYFVNQRLNLPLAIHTLYLVLAIAVSSLIRSVGASNAYQMIENIYKIIILLLVSEYLLQIFNNQLVFEALSGCGGDGVMLGYRELHNRTSYFLGLDIRGLNSIFLGPQFSSVIAVQFLTVQLHKVINSHHVDRSTYYYLFLSLFIFIASPTGSGLLILALSLIYLYFLNYNKISFKWLILSISSIIILLVALFYYLLFFHDGEYFKNFILDNIIHFSYLSKVDIFLGLGQNYVGSFDSIEVELLNLIAMDGIIIIFILLLYFVNIIFEFRFVKNERRSLLIKNSLYFLPLLASLMHYDTFLSAGIVTLTIAHLALAMAVKSEDGLPTRIKN